MWLTLVLILIFAACLGLLYNEGMWNNALRLINVVTAALLATNFYEPAATWLDRNLPSYTYFWDFLALWGLFAAGVTVFRALTDEVSKVKVRFLHVANRIGGIFFAVCIAWVLVCFTMMSLHTAPLARNFLFGLFQPEQRMLFGLVPDRQWLGFVHKLSMGPFRRSATTEEQQQKTYVSDPDAESKYAIFDENGDFLPKYATRRDDFESHISKYETILVSPQP